MAETRNLFFLREEVANVCVHSRRVPDLLQHPHHGFVGAAVQGAFQRANGRRDRRVNI